MLALLRVIGREQLADLVDRHLEVAQPGDRPGRLELRPSVAAIPGEPVDVGRPEQVELVVVPQRSHRQPGQAGEPPDRQEVGVGVGGGLGLARLAHVRDGGPSGHRRVKPSGVVEFPRDRPADESGGFGALAAEALALVLLERDHQVGEHLVEQRRPHERRPPRRRPRGPPPPAGRSRPRGPSPRGSPGTRPGRVSAAGPPLAISARRSPMPTGSRRRVDSATRHARRAPGSPAIRIRAGSCRSRPSTGRRARSRRGPDPRPTKPTFWYDRIARSLNAKTARRDPVQAQVREGVVEHQPGRLGAVAVAPHVLLADRDVEQRRAVVAVELAERARADEPVLGPQVDRQRERVDAERPGP